VRGHIHGHLDGPVRRHTDAQEHIEKSGVARENPELSPVAAGGFSLGWVPVGVDVLVGVTNDVAVTVSVGVPLGGVVLVGETVTVGVPVSVPVGVPLGVALG
jgi:hypothetical protein